MGAKPKEKVEKKPTAPEVKADKKAKAEVKPQFITKREQVVVKEPKQSFEQRTQTTPPWLNEDGTQNNG